MTTAADMFAAASGASDYARFDNIGDTVKGVVAGCHVVPNQFDEDGTNPTQIRIDLTQDDGNAVALYVKRGAMMAAIGAACQAHGQPEPTAGDTLAVQYVADGQPSRPGWNAPKQYVAQLAPGAPTAAGDLLADGDTPPATPAAKPLI